MLNSLDNSNRMGMRDRAEEGISCVRVVRVVRRGVMERLDLSWVLSRCDV